MSFEQDKTLLRKLESASDKFNIVSNIAKEARSLADEYNNSIFHSEAISYVMSGARPSNKYYYADEYEATIIKEMFCYIDDTEIKNAVYDSFYLSKSYNNLIYEYNTITDKPRQARVRVLTRMLWHRVYLDNYTKGLTTMAEEKKTRKRKSRKAVETVESVETVETVVEPTITEETVAAVIEASESIADVDATEDVEVIEPATEDIELTTKEETSDIFTEAETVPQISNTDEVVNEEKPKTKRTRKSKKAESEITKNAKQADSVADDKPKTKKSDRLSGSADAPIKINKPIWLYKTSVGKEYIMPIKGTYYRWRDDVVTGRICITDAPENKGNLSKILGWINESDIK